MKTISHRQSRRNSARRRWKVKARQARARRSRARSRPVFGAGRVHYEVGARVNAMSYGGIGVMRRLASKLGLVREVNARLKALKRHLPYHESDHVLNIAFNVLCGGTRLQDIESLRNNAAYMDAPGAETIPSPSAAGDFTRRLGEAGVTGLMDGINAVRPQLWRGRGRDLPAPVAYVDVDGTVAPTLGDRKEGMDRSYKGMWGYHPLVVSLANTGEVPYLVNRPGNVVSHSGAAEWIGRAVALVSPHVERVCVRGDTDFSLTAHFDRWSEEADFIFGYDAQPGMKARAAALDDEAWERLERRPRWLSRTGATRRRRENVRGRIVFERGYVNKRSQPFGSDDDLSYAVRLADADLDGDLDIIVANVGAKTAVYFNQGGGAVGFGEFRFGCDDCATYGVAVGDLNGDGFPEMVTANSGAPNGVVGNVGVER